MGNLETATARWARIFAWLLLGALAFVTIGPIGVRPVSQAPVGFEHLAAFGMLGLVFALAYPRRIIVAIIIAMGSAGLLEIAQGLDPSRHPRLSDAMVKLAGAAIGILAGIAIMRILRRFPVSEPGTRRRGA